jgi:hypothetical protein
MDDEDLAAQEKSSDLCDVLLHALLAAEVS